MPVVSPASDDKRRDAVAETKTHAFGSQTVRFKSRAPFAAFQGAQSFGDVFFQLAEKNRRVLAADRLFLVARDLLRRGVESEDASVEIGGHEAGANRRDDSFVQRAQVCQRLRCRKQAHVGA